MLSITTLEVALYSSGLERGSENLHQLAQVVGPDKDFAYSDSRFTCASSIWVALCDG